jgi:hypothetical protein
MTHFIELTSSEGNKFIANVSQIKRIVDTKGSDKNENTFIVGINNNGGLYVKESYEDIHKAICEKLRLHNPIIKL